MISNIYHLIKYPEQQIADQKRRKEKENERQIDWWEKREAPTSNSSKVWMSISRGLGNISFETDNHGVPKHSKY